MWYVKQSDKAQRRWAFCVTFFTLTAMLVILVFTPLWVVLILGVIGSFVHTLIYGRSEFDDLEDKLHADSLWLRERR